MCCDGILNLRRKQRHATCQRTRDIYLHITQDTTSAPRARRQFVRNKISHLNTRDVDV